MKRETKKCGNCKWWGVNKFGDGECNRAEPFQEVCAVVGMSSQAPIWTGRNFRCCFHQPKAKAKGTTIAAAEPFELGGQR